MAHASLAPSCRLEMQPSGSRWRAARALVVVIAVVLVTPLSVYALRGSVPLGGAVQHVSLQTLATDLPAQLVYLATDDAPASVAGAAPSSHISALNASTGAVVWRAQLSGLIAAAPIVANDTVYVSTSLPDTVFALTGSTGAVLWHTPLDAEPAGLASDQNAVYIGTVVAATNPSAVQTGGVEALGARDGVRLWSASLDGPATSPAVANGIVLVGATLLPATAEGFGAGQLVALAAGDGHPLWHAPLAAPPTPPAIADGIVVIGSGAVGFEASAASASEAGPSQFIGSLAAYTMSTSQRLWRRALAGPPSPIVANGIVYASVVTASGGDLVAYTPNDGKLLWREPLTGTPVGGMPVVANGVIALGDAVLTAGTQTVNLEGHAASDGKLVWSVPLLGSVNGLAAAPDAVYASIAVTPGSGDTPKDLLESHAASDGKLLWSVQPGGFIPFAPVVGP